MKTHRAGIWWLSALASVACTSATASAPESDGGSFDQGLEVAPGTTLSSASYTIEGPDGFLSAGTVAVGSSPDVPIVVGYLPVGSGYLVSIDATASDGVTVCSGHSTFDVADSSAVFTVVVHLACAVPHGDVAIAATLNVCPIVDGIDAVPTDVKRGGFSRLTLFAHDSDTGPSPLSFGWAINGIKLARQTSPSLSFTCTNPGDVTITGTVSDGDPNSTCADSSAVKVSCQ